MNTPHKQLNQSTGGFTIIEVVLVLAIAALIFLMVFLALPALQRGQRDTGRKNDVGVVSSALQTYLSNNKGTFGTATAPATSLTSLKLGAYIDSLGQYQKATATDPGTVSVAFGLTSVTAATNTLQVIVGSKCPTSIPAPGTLGLTLTTSGVSNRQAALVTALENDGTNSQAYCQDL